MDTLEINDIRAYGYTGVLPEETTLGQWFRVDLTLWLDLSLAGQSDRLEDTHDYCGAIAIVHDLIRNHPFKLIEVLASAIAQAVLKTDPRLQRIQVKLTKLTPPIPEFTGQIVITLTRDA
ncbi:dihydroneopterin aldolase [Leptolyngbya sp. PCC 6406]|uniref:dihydroneopterin aldolase n=1 Tax=Leptolyngbya sp. PCC 6406 TaxID=1173264 RepID=UPI0002ABAA98|nr:dihydroneopterin aldolase [Leptolyngbya sp. PCC 6406]